MSVLMPLLQVYQTSRLLEQPIKFVVMMKSVETNTDYVKGEHALIEKAVRQAILGEVGSSEHTWWIEARIGDCMRIIPECSYNAQQAYYLKQIFAGEYA